MNEQAFMEAVRRIEKLERRIEYLETVETASGWTDYTASSTITGWSSTSIEEIYYKKIGRLLFIAFDINGTSDSTSTNFTLPYTCTNDPSSGGIFTNSIPIIDNGSWATGYCYPSPNTNVLYFHPAPGAGLTDWTASGTKRVRGIIFIEVQ